MFPSSSMKIRDKHTGKILDLVYSTLNLEQLTHRFKEIKAFFKIKNCMKLGSQAGFSGSLLNLILHHKYNHTSQMKLKNKDSKVEDDKAVETGIVWRETLRKLIYWFDFGTTMQFHQFTHAHSVGSALLLNHIQGWFNEKISQSEAKFKFQKWMSMQMPLGQRDEFDRCLADLTAIDGKQPQLVLTEFLDPEMRTRYPKLRAKEFEYELLRLTDVQMDFQSEYPWTVNDFEQFWRQKKWISAPARFSEWIEGRDFEYLSYGELAPATEVYDPNKPRDPRGRKRRIREDDEDVPLKASEDTESDQELVKSVKPKKKQKKKKKEFVKSSTPLTLEAAPLMAPFTLSGDNPMFLPPPLTSLASSYSF